MKLFNTKPKQWGLRGDSELWDELDARFEMFSDPKSQIEFNEKLEFEFNELLKDGKRISDDIIWFENFSQNGMSGGSISIEWWNNKGLPLIKKLYSKTL